MDCDVLIVGGGPTGLTLAVDLGQRGVRTILVEQKERPAFLPKMERVNARTMEIYRRMGLSEQIRAAGLRPDCPMDVYIVLALNQPPLLRLAIRRSCRRRPKRAPPMTALCRSSPISSFRNTRLNRC